MKKLIDKALEAMDNAYAPYSNFKVGASVLCDNGNIYIGCNVENASYPATICAERVALSSAVAAGENSFKAIAIVCSNGGYAYPCGICRQVISELMPKGKVIVYSSNEDKYKEYSVSELLPYAFDKDNLIED